MSVMKNIISLNFCFFSVLLLLAESNKCASHGHLDIDINVTPPREDIKHEQFESGHGLPQPSLQQEYLYTFDPNLGPTARQMMDYDYDVAASSQKWQPTTSRLPEESTEEAPPSDSRDQRGAWRRNERFTEVNWYDGLIHTLDRKFIYDRLRGIWGAEMTDAALAQRLKRYTGTHGKITSYRPLIGESDSRFKRAAELIYFTDNGKGHKKRVNIPEAGPDDILHQPNDMGEDQNEVDDERAWPTGTGT